jgi:hypothetical protein
MKRYGLPCLFLAAALSSACVDDRSIGSTDQASLVLLSPADAAAAAGDALGLPGLAPVLVDAEGDRALFQVGGAFAIQVELRGVTYRVQVAWLDADRREQSRLVLIDAEDGALLDEIEPDPSFRNDPVVGALLGEIEPEPSFTNDPVVGAY